MTYMVRKLFDPRKFWHQGCGGFEHLFGHQNFFNVVGQDIDRDVGGPPISLIHRTYIKPKCCQLSPVHPPLAKLCHRSLLFARGFGHSLRLATRRQATGAAATSDTCAANLGSCRQ